MAELSPAGKKVLGIRTNKNTINITQAVQVHQDTQRCSKNHVKCLRYHPINVLSKLYAKRSMIVFSPVLCFFKNRAHITGVTVNDTIPEANIATIMVIENSLKTRPTCPSKKTMGINVAIKENVIDRIVKLISEAPLKAASNGPIPSSICRTTFSKNTIASSTKKPIASVKAIKDKLSSV